MFFFFIGNVGNGPGLTNSTSGKSTGAACKLLIVAVFVIVDSSVFVEGITTAFDSGWTSTGSIVGARGSKCTFVLCSTSAWTSTGSIVGARGSKCTFGLCSTSAWTSTGSIVGARGTKWTCGFSLTISAWTSTGSIIGGRGSKWTVGCSSTGSIVLVCNYVFSGVIDRSYSSADFVLSDSFNWSVIGSLIVANSFLTLLAKLS